MASLKGMIFDNYSEPEKLEFVNHLRRLLLCSELPKMVYCYGKTIKDINYDAKAITSNVA